MGLGSRLSGCLKKHAKHEGGALCVDERRRQSAQSVACGLALPLPPPRLRAAPRCFLVTSAPCCLAPPAL
jgi:hypothetical protein